MLNAKIATTTIPVQVPTHEQTYKSMMEKSLEALADTYDLSYQDMHKTIDCESTWNPNAFNPNDPNGSRGIAQFQSPTFYYYAKQLGLYKPDIWNPFTQIEVMSFMWSRGLAYHWSCWNNLSRV